jgi:hypothetical protein
LGENVDAADLRQGPRRRAAPCARAPQTDTRAVGPSGYAADMTPTATNQIVEVKTIQAGTADEPIFAVMIAANVLDATDLRPFVAEIVEQFKVQRMISPPSTTHMLLSVRGDTTAAAIKALWDELAAADPVVRFFMTQMLVADVVRAGRTGPALEQVSLLPAPT